MSVADATPRILERIQQDLVSLRGEFSEMRSTQLAHGEQLATLERHASAANELLGLMHERMGFLERASTVAQQGRTRLETRTDRLEARVEVLEGTAAESSDT